MAEEPKRDLESLLEHAARTLPDGCQVVIRVEKGWGGVSLDNDGDLYEYDDGDLTLAEQLVAILEDMAIIKEKGDA